MKMRIHDNIVIQRERWAQVYVSLFNEGIIIYRVNLGGGSRFRIYDERRDKWQYFKRLRSAVNWSFKEIIDKII